jgi:hypothetical protein
MIVRSNVELPAICPLILFIARAQKRYTIGIHTAMAVRPRLLLMAE